MATSFKKKASGKPSHPRGTRPSLHNAQLLASTGVPSMDALLGGGLAVGTVLLVEEDSFASYSRLLLKYFLSEGVMCGHALFVASACEKPEDILRDLPGAVDGELSGHMIPSQPQQQTEPPPSEQMKIAWRYQNLPIVQSSFSSRFGHLFDLTSSMDPARVEAVERALFNAAEMTASSAGEIYSCLRSTVHETISGGHFSVDEAVSHQRTILRVAVQSLGSPLWMEEGPEGSTAHSHTPPPHPPTLTQFLHSLRALLRRAYAVAMVTIPTHLMQDVAYVRRLERLCDVVVRLESFAGSEKEKNPLYKEYHGLFHLQKLPQLNSLSHHLPETLDLAFKLKRKRFSIEKLHLPPELSETASRTQEDPLPSLARQRRVAEHDSASGRKGRSRPLSKHDTDF